MNTDLSKLCADFLRASYTYQTSGKLKASHARELVAAFFGYKSHAALIVEKIYPLNNLEDAAIFIPDIPLIEQRRSCLSELPDDVLKPSALAELLSNFLQEEEYFGGDIWLYDSLESYIMEVLLIEDVTISNALSDMMAETNASFEDFPYYENARIKDTREALEVTVSGKLQGTPLDDKFFCGDTINMGVRVTLPRIAGKRGFLDFEINVGGAVNDDWRDKEMHYEVSNVRPKE